MGKPTTKRVTLSDVAKAAGVSIATASVAITGRASGNCRVSAPVAERIREAAKQLGYRPNLQARILSTQRTQTIGLLVTKSSWNAACDFLFAVQRALRPRAYTEIFLLHGDDDLSGEREHLESCMDRQVEGVIAMPMITSKGETNVELINRLHGEHKIPVVQLGTSLEGCSAPAVTIDETDAFAKAVKLLHSMGHQRIVHATIERYDNPAMRLAHQRYQGYRRGMHEVHGKERVMTVPPDGHDSTKLFEAGRTLGAALAKESDRPTAVMALCDALAAGVMSGLLDAGVKVPEEFSVLGYGGDPAGGMLRPAMGSIIPNYDRMAELATQTLLKLIDGAEAESAQVAPKLELRQSVGVFHS